MAARDPAGALIAVLVLFPLQLTTNLLGTASTTLARGFSDAGGMKFANPLKIIVQPSVNWITGLTSESGTWMLIIAAILLFLALRYIIVNLKALMIGRIEAFFDTTLFKSPIRANQGYGIITRL